MHHSNEDGHMAHPSLQSDATGEDEDPIAFDSESESEDSNRSNATIDSLFEDANGDGTFTFVKDFVNELNICTSALPGRNYGLRPGIYPCRK